MFQAGGEASTKAQWRESLGRFRSFASQPPSSLELAHRKDQRIEDSPDSRLRSCPGVLGSHGRAVSRGGAGNFWVWKGPPEAY